MPADGPVSLTKQSIYAAIPILDMYAAYHIKKLRKYILVVILVIVIPQVAIEFALFGDMLEAFDAYTIILEPNSDDFYQSVYIILWLPISIAFAIIIIRHWSKEWNYKTSMSNF